MPLVQSKARAAFIHNAVEKVHEVKCQTEALTLEIVHHSSWNKS